MTMKHTTLSLCFGGANAEESAILDLLIMRIPNNIHWTDNIFGMWQDTVKSLHFLKRYKNYFTTANIRIIPIASIHSVKISV